LIAELPSRLARNFTQNTRLFRDYADLLFGQQNQVELFL